MIRSARLEIEPAPARRPTASERARFTAPLLWCALGFLSGAIFWHVVGFWGFVSTAVFEGDKARPQIAAGTTPLETGSIDTRKAAATAAKTSPVKSVLACAALTLDRSSGQTSMSACSANAWHLRHTGDSRRQDRQLAVGNPGTAKASSVAGWATTAEDIGADLTIR